MKRFLFHVTWAVALITFLPAASQEDQTFKIKAKVGPNKNVGMEPNPQTGEILVYWEMEGSLFTSVLKLDKQDPEKFKAGKANEIRPGKGSYRRPKAIFNPDTGGYLLVCDTWKGDFPLRQEATASANRYDLVGLEERAAGSKILLIKIQGNGKKKGKPKTLVKGKQANLAPIIEGFSISTAAATSNKSIFTVFFTKAPVGFQRLSGSFMPAADTPGIWTIECRGNGKCGKAELVALEEDGETIADLIRQFLRANSSS